jgi:hypothetical protein
VVVIGFGSCSVVRGRNSRKQPVNQARSRRPDAKARKDLRWYLEDYVRGPFTTYGSPHGRALY